MEEPELHTTVLHAQETAREVTNEATEAGAIICVHWWYIIKRMVIQSEQNRTARGSGQLNAERDGNPQAWGTPCKFGAGFSWQLQLPVQQAQLSNEKDLVV